MCPCIILQDFVGIDDMYNSTLYIVDEKNHSYSIVGLQNTFLLHQDEFPEKMKYEASIQLTFTCSSIPVSRTSFEFSESHWSYQSALLYAICIHT